MSEVPLAGSPGGTTKTSRLGGTGRRRARRLALGLAATLAVASGLAYSSGPGGAVSDGRSVGVLVGSVPLCYGPGPDLNLTPTQLVVAAQNGETKAAATVPATTTAHSYRLSIPPGTYLIRAGKWPTRKVDVQPGTVTVADLPGGACL